MTRERRTSKFLFSFEAEGSLPPAALLRGHKHSTAFINDLQYLGRFILSTKTFTREASASELPWRVGKRGSTDVLNVLRKAFRLKSFFSAHLCEF